MPTNPHPSRVSPRVQRRRSPTESSRSVGRSRRPGWIPATRPILSLLGCVFGTTIAAQTTVCVPAVSTTSEGERAGELAGFDSRAKQQILVPGILLVKAKNKDLTALSFRRDDWLHMAVVGGSTDLHVTLSHARSRAIAPSAVFTDNAGTDATTVFAARLALPSSPVVQGTPTWIASHVARIQFSTPFRYRGGDLCVEVRGEPVSGQTSPSWVVDYATPGAGR